MVADRTVTNQITIFIKMEEQSDMVLWGQFVVGTLIYSQVLAVEGYRGMVEAIHAIDITLFCPQSLVSYLHIQQQFWTAFANSAPIACKHLCLLMSLLAFLDGATEICLIILAVI